MVQSEKPQELQDSCGFSVFNQQIALRPMTIADLDDVMAIERRVYHYPWSANFFLQELQVVCARSILAEISNTIIAYVLYWRLPGTLDIQNIAVDLPYQRRGVARRLLSQVILEAKKESIERITLEVRISNLAAQGLYRSLGFSTSGVRKAYYSDNGEDAFAMTLDLCAK